MGNAAGTPAHYEGDPGAVASPASSSTLELKPGKDKQQGGLKSLLSPRKPRKQKMCDFAPLAEITPDEVELGENVGWGATGVIKKAKWRGMECAAKLLFPGTDLARFKQELATWCTLDHPCVTQVFGACPDPAQLMIIMEYVPYGNLADYLRNAAVERRSLESLYPLVYRVALDVAHAITYLHNSTNYIYRDLKPANILLNSTDPQSEIVAKVCDFGDCRIVSKTMTPRVGTISYMAPEVFATDSYTRQADVYSYGVILWEMITRQEPYEEIGFVHEIAERVRDGYRPTMPEYVPAAIESLIQDCWQTNPVERPDFVTIIGRLKEIAEIWDQLDLSQILASLDSTTDLENDTDFTLNWVDTTFADLDVMNDLRAAEEEMDISDDLSWEQSAEEVSEKNRRVTRKSSGSQVGNKRTSGLAKSAEPRETKTEGKRARSSSRKEKSRGRSSTPKQDREGKEREGKARRRTDSGNGGSSGSRSSKKKSKTRSGSSATDDLEGVRSRLRHQTSSLSESSPSASPTTQKRKKGHRRGKSSDVRGGKGMNMGDLSVSRESCSDLTQSVETPADDEESTDTSYDEIGSDEELKTHRHKKKMLDTTPASPAPKIANLRKAEQLRSLSQGKQNLQQLLVDTQVTGKTSSQDADLLITVLKASLKRETERVKKLKRTNDFLKEKFKEEHVERRKLDIKLSRTNKQLQEAEKMAQQAQASGGDAGSVVRSSRSPVNDVTQMKTFVKHSFRGAPYRSDSFVAAESLGASIGVGGATADDDGGRWCELPFSAVQPQHSPYLYSTFGVWYHALWKRYAVRLCVVIGGINVQYITKFRKLCSIVQLVSNHPNMASLIGIVTQAPNYCLVFEGLEGYNSLSHFVEKAPSLTFERKLAIAVEIAAAIEHCHEQNRPLGHISSDSILVKEDGTDTKVMHMCHLSFFSQRVDTTWIKYRWMAPECIYGRGRTSKASDVFEFGILLWYLVMEEIPYSSLDGEEIVERLSMGWRLQLPVNLPRKLKSLFTQCWKNQAEDRASMTTVYNELCAIQQEGITWEAENSIRLKVAARPSFVIDSSEDALGDD
mmetsp:Transcript_15519/g.60702  ORF Transcript_15519/g.60702 Transcript_15519/m.60702 type:complete len:1066 (+) Transcript_15519:180-3377(+)